MEVIEVFAHNFHEVTRIIDSKLGRGSFDVITLDTEFPGCLRRTPQHASMDQRYADLRYNVQNTKLVQVGITISDKNNNVAGTWQFNLADFNPEVDPCAPESVSLLMSSGIDFTKNMLHGIPGRMLAVWLGQIIVLHRHNLTWVTFHGLYDFGYLISLVTSSLPLPETVSDFVVTMRDLFGHKVYDLKVIGERYVKRGLGLERLAETVGVTRAVGVAHQAGSDSLLSAVVFGKMKEIGVELEFFKGSLYGICDDDYGGRRRVDVSAVELMPATMYHGVSPQSTMHYRVSPPLTLDVWHREELFSLLDKAQRCGFDLYSIEFTRS